MMSSCSECSRLTEIAKIAEVGDQAPQLPFLEDEPCIEVYVVGCDDLHAVHISLLAGLQQQVPHIAHAFTSNAQPAVMRKHMVTYVRVTTGSCAHVTE